MRIPATAPIPAYALFGEGHDFPDVLHIETITSRAQALDWRIPPHRHPALHQFLLVEHGRAEVTVEGTALVLNEPMILSLPARTVHGFLFARGTVGHVLSVPLTQAPGVLEGDAPLARSLSRWGLIPAGASLRALFAQISAEHAAQHLGRASVLRALAVQVAATVARDAMALAPPVTAPARAAGNAAAQRLARFEALIGAHLRDQWRVADYARAMAITPTHLSRLTRHATGLSARSFIEAALFQEARRLLAYTRADAASVGYQLGFEDPSYFSRAFRRHTGLTPTAYRAQVNAWQDAAGG